MSLGFRGEVVDFYQRYRRGYPPDVIDLLVETFTLTRDDVIVDLGCGTGQLTVPLARRVRAAIGMDPEPDMLSHARTAATRAANITWVLGADTDVPKLTPLLGEHTVAAITIGQALHWMRHDTLFRNAQRLLRPGGGIAVITNGAPLWLQDSDWSRALRDTLENWLGEQLTRTCGTDDETHQRYRTSLLTAGYEVEDATFDHIDALDLEQIVGGVYSAMSVNKLPTPRQRPAFAELIQRALEPHHPYIERIQVKVLSGRVPID